MDRFDEKQFNDSVRAALDENPALLKDWRWRISNLYCVVDKNQKKVIFKPNRAQRAFMEIIDDYPMFVILKSRQLGFTTFVCLYFLDKILWGNNIDAAMIAHLKEIAQDIFDKKAMYAAENLPECVKGLVEIDAKTARKLKVVKKTKEGAVMARNLFVTLNSTRGGTFTLTHISELAKIYKISPQKASEVLTGSMSSIAIGSKLFIESTAEGMEGLFYETFNSSWRERGQFKTDPAIVASKPYPLFFNWTYDDEQIEKFYDMYGIIPLENMEVVDIDWARFKEDNELTDKQLSWYYAKWKGLNKNTSLLFQEYPTTPEDAFMTTGQGFFPNKRLVQMLDAIEAGEVPLGKRYDVPGDYFEPSSFGPFTVFEEPEPNAEYIIGADVGEGLSNSDSSTIAVIKKSTLEPVAFYESKIVPHEFAEVCVTVAKYYNNGLLVIESNNHGYTVNDLVNREHTYSNMYMQRSYDDISGKYTTKLGWSTTSKTRSMALNNFRQAFSQTKNWYYKNLLLEMQTFVRSTRGKFEAAHGKHDDLVMCCAFAYGVISIIKEEEKKQQEEEDPSKLFFLGKIGIEEFMQKCVLK